MSIQIRDGGGILRAVSGLRIRDAAGIIRTINTGSIRDAAGIIRTFFTSMMATINYTVAAGTEYGVNAATVTTSPPSIISITGGTAPHTYAWSYVSGETGIVATSPTSATTSFSKTLFVDEYVEATWQCLATDSSGATATAQVRITLQNVSSN